MEQRTMTRDLNNEVQASWSPVSAGLLQRKCECGSHAIGGACDKCAKEQESSTLQRASTKMDGPNEVPSVVYDVLSSSGQPLDIQTRHLMEPRFGQDFSHVRVHTDTQAADSARAVNALAYTVGHNIVFAAGRYEPVSGTGLKLLAHELAHTVQQGSATNTPSSRGISLGAPDSAHEHEAAAAENHLGFSQSHTATGVSLQRKTWDTLPVYNERPEIIAAKNSTCPISDTGTLSEVSWGETSGLYPTKDNKYDPSKWDATKTCELLAARAAVHAVGQRGEKVHRATPGKDPIEQKLKPYHFTENFPAVDSEISDTSVKWFYLSPKSSLDQHPTMSSLISVKKYGPFYNIGGGDVARGDVYIHFYKKKP
jgi:hypothetical protein